MIVQDDHFDVTNSVTVCALTTDPTDAPLFRVLVEPDSLNGLSQPSRLMVDKLTTMPRANLQARIGRLTDEHMVQLSRAIVVFLGLA